MPHSLRPLPSCCNSAFREQSFYKTLNIGVHEYSAKEAEKLSTPIKFCFATLSSPKHSPINPVIQHLYQPLTLETLHCPKSPQCLFSFESLRCDKSFSSFTIYPTTEASLRVNQLLWQVVRNGTYDPAEGDPLLGAHVFVLGLAPELHNLLSRVSLNDIHRGIIDFLVLLHHQLTSDGDDHGLFKLRQDLLPRIWDELNDNIGRFPTGEPTDPYRAKILEHLVQISFMTPWRVDVFAAYLTANDVTAVLDPLSATSPTSRYSLLGTETKPEICLQGKVMLKLYQDWRVFSTILHDGMGLPYDHVTEGMERVVHAGKSAGLLEQAFTVLRAGETACSYFFKLPSDVLERKVLPWIVRRGCEAIAPRHRKLASLKSLLEISSQYLDDLQAIGNLADNLDSDTSELVTTLLDSTVQDANRANGDLAVRTSDRVGLGIHANRVLSSLVLGDVAESLSGLQLHEVFAQVPGDTAVSHHCERHVAVPEPVPMRFSIDTSWIYPLNNALWEHGEDCESAEPYYEREQD